MQITAIAVDEDALDGVGSLSGIQCGHVRAGEDLLTQMSQPAASQAGFSPGLFLHKGIKARFTEVAAPMIMVLPHSADNAVI